MPTKHLTLSWKADRAVKLSGSSTAKSVVPEKNQQLDVLETPMSVNLHAESNNTTPYGLPISPALAVALIADLQDRLMPPALTGIIDALPNEADKTTLKELEQLLVHSAAITIDKSVLLKMLSQPGCEGVRFYLCRKEEEVELPGGATETMAFASLVTVGVDSSGQDLHYHYQPGSLEGGLTESSLSNTSLIAEYGSPPPPPKNFALTAAGDYFDDRYALLKYAQEHVTVNRRMNN
jgi:hypothetical protein